MKTENNKKGLSLKKFFLICGAVGAVFGILSIVQAVLLVDDKTGFFADKTNFSVPLFYALFLVFTIGTVVLGYISKKQNFGKEVPSKNIFQAISCLIFAVILCFTGVKEISSLISVSSSADFGFFEYAKLNGGIITAIKPIAAVLSGIVMLFSSVTFFSGINIAKKIKICQLFPVLWAFCTTVSYFAITVSYLHSPVLMINIFASAFLMLFFFEYARYISGFDAQNSAWAFNTVGILALVLLITSGFSTLLGKNIVHCQFNIDYFAAALFCLSSIIMRSVYGNKATVVAPEVKTEAPEE